MLAAINNSSAFDACTEQSYEHIDGRLEAHVNDVRVRSEFQAIYSLSHRKPIGYEGLLRVRDQHQRQINPAHFFTTITGEGEKVRVDRLARFLHTQNFRRAGGMDGWLFLNIHPEVIMNGPKYGSFFGKCLEATDISPENIVVEILENSIADRGLLNDAVQYYRDIGCKIAIDDFGAMASNIDRLWALEPDIVKLDRSLVVELDKPSVRRLLPSLVSMIHECGSLVLMEGIETEDQALTAIDSGVDLVQGFYFARPSKDLCGTSPTASVGSGDANIPNMCEKYYRYVFERQQRHDDTLARYLLPFEQAARAHAFSGSLTGFDEILRKAGVERCYILDRKGFQVGNTLFPEKHDSLFPTHFGHLGEDNGSSWFRRHYFRRAVTSPGKVHYTRPYLSLTGGIICKTLSISLSTPEGDTRIYCCDIDWSDCQINNPHDATSCMISA